MRPTEQLKSEHRVIEQVLDCLDRMGDRCRDDRRLEADSARQVIDFFRTFADKCHHGKEEVHLFPMMEARGFPTDSGPLAVMLAEHEQGRDLIGRMERAIDAAAAGDESGCSAWLEAARSYSVMLRAHIDKEDHCLFPMADQSFGAGDQAELRKQFDAVEHDEIGPEVHQRFLQLADSLAEQYGVVKSGHDHAAGCGAADHGGPGE